MPQTKPRYMLIEHDRYFYQRKVPLEFQAAVGRKKWRAPLGSNFDDAYERLKALRGEHDELISRLSDPEEHRVFKTKQRRFQEQIAHQHAAAEQIAYEKWCRENGVMTDTEEYVSLFGADDYAPWQAVDDWLDGLEHERQRHLPPSQPASVTASVLTSRPY